MREIAGFAVQLGALRHYKWIYLSASFSNAIKLPENEGMADDVFFTDTLNETLKEVKVWNFVKQYFCVVPSLAVMKPNGLGFSSWGFVTKICFSTLWKTLDSVLSFLYGFIGGKASYETARSCCCNCELTKQSKRVPGICFVLPNNSFFSLSYVMAIWVVKFPKYTK